MRDYGKVFCAIWASEDFRSMSEDSRTLALYLLTCQHCTAVGAFRLPDAYAADDLQWSVERVLKGFAELSANGFASRDERSKWVCISKFLDWNPIENPNQAKSAAKLIDQVPEGGAKSMLLQAVRRLGRYMTELGVEPLPNPLATVTKPVAVAVTGAVTGAGSVAGATVPAAPPPADDAGLPEDPPSDDPPPEDPPVAEKRKALTFNGWLKTIPDGELAIPADHYVFTQADRAGLPYQFVELEWEWFRWKYSNNPKRYTDWRQTFANAVAGAWGNLWRAVPAGGYELTSNGIQFQRTLERAA